jgi:ATP-binding cassette, subfamily B, bacterial
MSDFFCSGALAILQQLGLGSERVLACVAGDLDTKLRFAAPWLVVTDRRVVLFSPEDRRSCTEIPLNRIRSVKVDLFVGGGQLVICGAERELGTIYFSNSVLSKFVEIAPGIEQLIQTGNMDPPARIDQLRCRSCGRLLAEKNGICPKCVDRLTTFRRLFEYLAPHRVTWIALLAVLLVSTAAELAPALAIRKILDHIVRPDVAMSVLVALVAMLLGARLAMWLCETAKGRLSAWLGARITADMRKDLFNRIVHFPIRTIDSWSVGTLLSRFVNDIARLDEFFGSGAPLLVMTLFVLLGILVVLVYLSPSLTLAILLPVPLIVLWTRLIWKMLRRIQDKQSSSIARLSMQIRESLTGIRVIKALCREDEEYRCFRNHNDRVCDVTEEAELTSFSFFTVIYFLMNLGVMLVWYVGGRQVLRNTLTVGTLLAAVSYLWMLYWPLQWFGQVSNSLSQALTGAVQFLELADSPVEEQMEQTTHAMRPIRGSIRFQDVAFGYEPSKPVLKNINFDVLAGEVIGVIGRSGTGKTTLINLLCRFYEPTQGAIFIDGVNIREYSLNELRAQVAIVPQDTFLFSGTIEENIRYGRPGASFEEIVAAARAANAHKVILERPEGYDSLVGSGGDRLSGGERQRIAIARAILADPQILILDEATSSVDVESEMAIQKALARISHNRTTLIIAHRLSTIRSADRLIVLDQGRIVESGRYDQLLSQKGLLWNFANAFSETRDFQ